MKSFILKQSPSFRLFIIAALSLLLLIPVQLIENLIVERQVRQEEANKEVFKKWGGAQFIEGPVLIIPFIKNDRRFNAYLCPEYLNIRGSLQPEVRYRGLYEVALYQSDLKIEGHFIRSSLFDLGISEEQVLWDETFLSLQISDLKGIESIESLKVGPSDKTLSEVPVIQNDVGSGIGSKISFSTPGSLSFNIELKLNGSQKLLFSPLAQKTEVQLQSSWKDPSFSGDFLPEKQNVNDDGFDAQWKVLQVNRKLPQAWIGGDLDTVDHAFGVQLYIPVDEYQKSLRTTKYALMFILLMFLAFFLIDVFHARVCHPIQYLLIGLALILFYSLLISISEHMPFNQAYMIAATSTVILIVGYSKSILKSKAFAMWIGLMLISLYAFLFIILQSQDHALLMGSIGLTSILALVMYATRNLDWFKAMSIEPKHATPNAQKNKNVEAVNN